MLRARDVIGLPVWDTVWAKRLGEAEDLVFGEDHRPVGLLIAPKRWFAPGRMVRPDGIRSISREAVAVSGREAVIAVRSLRPYHTLLSGRRKLAGLPVVTEDGETLGTVHDVYISSLLDGPILGFELSEGWVSDLLEGRRWLPAPDFWSVGDAVLVPAGSERDLRPTDGALPFEAEAETAQPHLFSE